MSSIWSPSILQPHPPVLIEAIETMVPDNVKKDVTARSPSHVLEESLSSLLSIDVGKGNTNMDKIQVSNQNRNYLASKKNQLLNQTSKYEAPVADISSGRFSLWPLPFILCQWK